MYHEGLYQEIRKSKIEIFVDEESVPGVIEAIAKAAHAGNVCDGRIFVVSKGSVLMRTGEHVPGRPPDR